MNRRIAIVFLFCMTSVMLAQSPGDWSPDPAARSQSVDNESPPVAGRREITPIGLRSGSSKRTSLSSDAGQIWREYDIRSFTDRSRSQEQPEQTIVDWILRETGTNTWFGEPMGVLSANRDTITVYHTRRVQAIVEGVIDRFLNTPSEANEVGLRLVTVDSPNWRVKAARMLTRVQTQTPGIEAWLISRENAALLLHELGQRADYRDHSSPNLTIFNGQTHAVKGTRPRMFSAGQQTTSASPQMGRVDEGFSLQVSPLVSREGDSIEAVIKCSVNQVEGFTPLWVSDVDQFGMLKRSQVKVPQVSSWQLHERFRWPINEVLLVSRGLVASPGPANPSPLRKILDSSSSRSNALLFLESRSEVKSAAQRRVSVASRTDPSNYRGRY